MKFDNEKVNALLNEMEAVLVRIKAIRINFCERLDEKKQKAA